MAYLTEISLENMWILMLIINNRGFSYYFRVCTQSSTILEKWRVWMHHCHGEWHLFLCWSFIIPVLKNITDIQYFAAWNTVFNSPGTEEMLNPRQSTMLSFKYFLCPSPPYHWSTTVADSTVSSTFIFNSWHCSQWSSANLQQLKIWPNSAVLLYIPSSSNQT